MQKKLFRVAAGALCLIGAGLSLGWLCVLGASLTPWPLHRAEGVVIGYHRELTGSSVDSLRYYPIIRYTDTLGKTWSFQSFSPSKSPTYATGAVVSVVYDLEDNPKELSERIAEPPSSSRWVLITLAALSLVTFALAGYALLNGRPIRDVIRSVRRHDALPDKACRTG